MIGRAGRPQFESSAVAIFMTKAGNAQRYHNLANGRAPIESRLHKSLAEFLNAAIAQRIVCSVPQAYAWLQSTYLWQRLFINPAAYGMSMPGCTPEMVGSRAKHMFIDVALQRLVSAGLIQIFQENISALDPGRCGTSIKTQANRQLHLYCCVYVKVTSCCSLMCKHSMQLGTMALIHNAPKATSMRDLLQVRCAGVVSHLIHFRGPSSELYDLQIVCSASENADIPLRRSEKKVLNDLNAQAHAQERSDPGSTFAVLEGVDSDKKKQRLSEPWEKCFVLVRFHACHLHARSQQAEP